MSSLSQFIGSTTSKAGVVRLTDSVSSTSTTTAATAAAVKVAYDATVPVGGIILWSGTVGTIPANWALCNGSNGTPDLRNQFVIGASGDASIDSVVKSVTTVTGVSTKDGGTKDSVVVSHTHGVTDPGHFHSISGSTATTATGTAVHATNAVTTAVNTTSKTTGIAINAAGVSGTNQNLPPYFALAYIMRLA
jgi:hypothetical protein